MSGITTGFGINTSLDEGWTVNSPLDGSQIGVIARDDSGSVNKKTLKTAAAQQDWLDLGIKGRAGKLLEFAGIVDGRADEISKIINVESGKPLAEAKSEVANFSATIRNTVGGAGVNPDDLNGMKRRKRYIPVGTVGLITSFNFPLAVAGWNIAPAMLAGNAVVWKPSEKTPLTALVIKSLFDYVTELPNDLLQVVVGEIEVGKALVEHEKIGMISATGSVAMGNSIAATLRNKEGNKAAPIIEAGGNNAVIISEQNSAENLQFAVDSITKSFLGTSGQRCTNTRRLFIAESVFEQVLDSIKQKINEFNIDTPLIDEGAYDIYDKSCIAAKNEGGQILFGGRVLSNETPDGFYVNPALAVMPEQTGSMHEECFAPLLYIVRYNDFAKALEMVNAPTNAGLVNGIYTESRDEVTRFTRRNLAGHTVVNSPSGTGTPAFGMGFGGNKESGTGEILNQEDPLRAFTVGANRVAVNSEISLR